MNPRRAAARLATAAIATVLLSAAHAADEPVVPRVEARSSDLLAVGVVHGERMTVHLSSLADNAPVRDATVNVTLRGNVHPTTAEADGSYTLDAKDLTLPGNAGVAFKIARGAAVEELKGVLRVGETDVKSEDKGAARQGLWWVLNFGVCIGFLWLLSRRRKSAAT